MHRSIATVCLSGTLEEKLAIAGQVGFDGVEIFESDLITCPGPPAQIRKMAADRGIRIAYEALAWGTHVADFLHAWRIVEAADHPGLGLCLDSFHILSRPGADPAPIRQLPADRLFFLQLADAPRLNMDVLQWSRHFRCFPGQGGFDLTTFLGHVLAAGYRGPLSLEVFNDAYRQADPERTATDALRSLIALEEAAAGGLLPAPERLDGYAFAELSVDLSAEMAADDLLRRMGFMQRGVHRSKPVRLWEQGPARVLLNRSRQDTDSRPRGAVCITAVAVESADPAGSARRAAALLAPAIPRGYGPGEADLTAVAVPNGTAVFFCRTDLPHGWREDFTDLEAPGDVGAITGIDHVGLSHPPHHFLEAALFYESVLGLHRHASMAIPDPYGLVNSRAVSTADGAVRMVLTVPALGGTPSPPSADLQHVAFACTDIFTTARRMRAAGVPTLAVPGNYYADLAARIPLDPELLVRLRDHGVLYDRDDEGGEFFHFYTGMLGPRMFFEIVQRTGGYDGYGFSNTPVRMAAQYRHSVGRHH